ncbi:MAG: zinc ABC transporter substrate-binding protein [Solobacterium sp.]|nr:zinc ABC transporter substrate-binding protein [Solobacterium sp.]
MKRTFLKQLQKRLLSGLVVFLFVGMLQGCTTIRKHITYTVYPVGFLVERLIAGTNIKTESIQEDTIVQRAKIRSDYATILENTELLLYIGQLEPYLQMYRSEINEKVPSRIDLSTMNAVYDFKRYTPVIAEGEVTYIESPYYRDKAFDYIDTDQKDLYLWTDPIAMLSMAKDILNWLNTTFVEDELIFDENFTRLETELINLDAQYQSLASNNIANNKVIRFVSMTASFGNWQKTYGLEVYPVILSKYGALPNAEQLALIKQRILEDGVKYIVYEPNMTEDMIALFNELQEELGLTRVELNNLSSLSAEDDAAGKDYLSIMYENLKVLETMVEDRSPSEEVVEVVNEGTVEELQDGVELQQNTVTATPVPGMTPVPNENETDG